ncbi:lyase [Synechococcus phage S-CREM1]|nr:lyase [Synechococcus phage S-CREM1]
MSLTRLKNIITSRTGRIIYVNPDDFDASDSIDNRGNSALRPFKTLQRALLEVSRFSYRVGLSNDEYDAFSIYLYPSEYIIDNRPGEILYTEIPPLDENSNFDVTSPNNVLYKFNSVEGGVIVPRGCSIVGSDLRRTKIIPKYVPYPTTRPSLGITAVNEPAKSAIFRVTGGCYFWQFSFFDGDSTGVYYKENDATTIQPNYSHHKLTAFEFADGRNELRQLIADGNVRPNFDINSSIIPDLQSRTDLEIYYQKISRAFTSIPDTSGTPAQDQLQPRIEENRIVGPISDEFQVLQITRNGQTATAITVDELGNPKNHGFSVGVSVNISGVTGSSGTQSELDASLYNGSFQVTSAQGNVFTYQMSDEPTGNAVGSNILVKVEIDTVDSSSPYVFNLSLRSVWGMNGMHADGGKTTGFKSMVVAQFTGLSLQKDDRAFVRYNTSTGSYDEGGQGAHLDGACRYKKGWRHVHIKASNDAFIQVVSVFAVGYGDHFFADSGADMSITNSNSNFGNTALRCKGFKAAAFTKDKFGTLTHIIPPKSLSDVPEVSVNWVNVDIQRTKVVANSQRLYLYGYTNADAPPPRKVQGYTVGARQDGTGGSAVPDKLYCLLISSGSTTATVKSARINPYGPSVTTATANTADSPLKYDSNTYNVGGQSVVGGWYLQVSSTSNEIFTTLTTNAIYNTLAFTPTTFIKRVPDARVLKDRIYRLRYVMPKDSFPVPRAPITGYVLQPRSSESSSPSYNKVYYIYEIETHQQFERGVADGIYYLSVLCASITPTTSNFDDFRFSQNVNEVYPAFDRDNPNADPTASVSIADNVTIGLVYGTDGATPTPNKDTKRSITKEAAQFFLAEAQNNLAWNASAGTIGSFALTARLGDAESRMIPLKVDTEGEMIPIPIELRRHSIQRSGNHTFEYTGFGPGNYSTAFPQTQVEVLTADQVKLSQSLKEAAGVSFYSGLNSNGDLFIGNQVINPVTGQITSDDIAQLNVVGEENTTIQTFSELVLTDKLTVLGGASNQLESLFAGPVTFQGKITSDSNIQVKKLTYANPDGTILKSTLMAPDNGSGQPNLSALTYYTTPIDGDIVYNTSWTPGKNLGWMYYSNTWYKFGLTNTGFIDIATFGANTNMALGGTANSTYRLDVTGNQHISGDLVVDGKGGVSPAKYILRSYTGDGTTQQFTISSGHNSRSVMVFINGVCQVPDTNYTVSGTNVVFGSGDAPRNGDNIQIREFPI